MLNSAAPSANGVLAWRTPSITPATPLGAVLPLGVAAAAARGGAAGATQPGSASPGAVKEIAVIGVQALHPTFHSSGSGQVAAAYAPAPLNRLRDALRVPAGEDCRTDKTVCVRHNTGENHQDAAKLAAAADVAIVFVACTGSEGQDRLNLTLSAAIVVAFMPGKQYGHAIGDVLLGPDREASSDLSCRGEPGRLHQSHLGRKPFRPSISH